MGAYKKDFAGIGRMLRMPEIEAALRAHAEAIAADAAAVAPVGDPASDPHAGRYKESFHVSSGSPGGAHHDRAFARVENDAPEAFYVEYGTSKQEGRHVLRAASEVQR